MEKFHEILHLYFNPMKDKNKESHLKIARQIQLLIKACSVPHQMSGYHGDPYPEKAKLIGRKLRFELRGKVAIGCTSLDAVAMYEEFLKERFPQRPCSSFAEMWASKRASTCSTNSKRQKTASWSARSKA